VPFQSDAKVVENITRIQVGEGIWKTATGGPTDFKIVAADPVMNRRIVEAEDLVVGIRDPNNPNLQKPRPGIPLEIPDEYADSHGRMIHIAKSYYEEVQDHRQSRPARVRHEQPEALRYAGDAYLQDLGWPTARDRGDRNQRSSKQTAA
jgi:hypothetical protein